MHRGWRRIWVLAFVLLASAPGILAVAPADKDQERLLSEQEVELEFLETLRSLSGEYATLKNDVATIITKYQALQTKMNGRYWATFVSVRDKRGRGEVSRLVSVWVERTPSLLPATPEDKKEAKAARKKAREERLVAERDLKADWEELRKSIANARQSAAKLKKLSKNNREARNIFDRLHFVLSQFPKTFWVKEPLEPGTESPPGMAEQKRLRNLVGEFQPLIDSLQVWLDENRPAGA